MPDGRPQLPHSPEIEAAVLGAMLIDRETVLRVIDVLRPDDFYVAAHRTIYAAMLGLVDAGGDVDLPNIKSELERRGRLGVVGGVTSLVEIADAVLTAASAPGHARLIREKSNQRRLIAVGAELVNRVSANPGDLSDLVGWVQTQVEAIDNGDERHLRPVADVAGETLAQFDRYRTGAQDDVIVTPYADLNDMLVGGFRYHHYTILAGRPGEGKTTLAHNLATAAAMNGEPVLIFSLEMSAHEVVERMACASARVNGKLLRMGRLDGDDFLEVCHAVERIAGLPIEIDDSARLTDMQVRARTRSAARRGTRFVVVDYLQLLHGSGRFDSRENEVAAMSRAMMATARENDVSILVLSQFNREGAKRATGRPILSDLRESGALEQDANNVMMLYHPWKHDKNADPNVAELIIAKQRNGPTGSVRLHWAADMVTFDALATDDAPTWVTEHESIQIEGED